MRRHDDTGSPGTNKIVCRLERSVSRLSHVAHNAVVYALVSRCFGTAIMSAPVHFHRAKHAAVFGRHVVAPERPDTVRVLRELR
jgi:hypothetical protein